MNGVRELVFHIKYEFSSRFMSDSIKTGPFANETFYFEQKFGGKNGRWHGSMLRMTSSVAKS